MKFSIKNGFLITITLNTLAIAVLIVARFITFSFFNTHNKTLLYTLDFLNRMQDHTRFVYELENQIDKHQNITLEKDFTKCNLGKWLIQHKDAFVRLQPSIKNSILKIDSLHKALHKDIQLLDNYISAAQIDSTFYQKAEDYFYNHTLPLYDSIITHSLKVIETIKDSDNKLWMITTKRNLYAFLTIIIILLLNIFLWLTMYKKTTHGINLIKNLLSELRNGRLTVYKSSLYTNVKEFDQLLNIFKDSLQNIANQLKAVIEFSNQVHSAAQQITYTSNKLASGATEQAASTEEVSVLAEQMTAISEQNAERANNASKLSNIANQLIHETQTKLSALDDIINEIAEDVSVIQGISANINILAINASIEAARSEAANKSFEVVANEIKNLANTTNIATKKILETTQKGVQAAIEAYQKAHETFEKITNLINFINEIADASKQQIDGIESVNQSIQQLSQLAQENATAAEQLSSTAEALSQQAKSLKQQLEFFKIANNN